jgi:cytochrome c heme-lyase
MPSATEASKAPTSDEDAAAKCPVDHSTRSTWQNLVSLPPGHPIPPSTRPLSTKREISSIPRGPSGQKDSTDAKGDGKWVYPSESQFYAALLRKHQAGPSTVGSSHGEETSSTAATLGAKDHGVIEVDAAGAAVTNRNIVKPPRADDMRVVVPIHNAVNEQTWAKVLQWEAEQGGHS